MNYGGLIGDAFRITLRNRYLWFFGFFVAGGSSLNIPSGGGNFGGQDGGETGSAPAVASAFAQAGGEAFGNVALLLGIVALALLVFLLFVALALISTGALADSVAAIDRGEGRRFSSTWRTGISNFWRVLGYHVLIALIGLALLLVVAIPATLLILGVLAATGSVGLRIALIGLIALAAIAALILLFIPLVIVGQLALRELVVGRESVTGSIGGGYRLFRRNPGRSLLVWLIQLGVMLGAGIALLIATLLAGLLLFAPTIVLALLGYGAAAVATGVAAGLILLPLLLVASGALGTFKHGYWTLAYLRLAAPPVRDAGTG